MPGRIGSANPTSGSMLQAPSSIRRARATSLSPAAAESLYKPRPAPDRGRRRPDRCRPRTASGAPRARPSTRPSRRARVRVTGSLVGRRFGLEQACASGSVRRRRLGSRARSERVNDRWRRPRPATHPPRRAAPPRGVRRAAASSTAPSGVRTDATSRRFWVSVPVLSVTIRSTAPSVSSAFRRRTRTPRLSRRYAPRPRMTARRTGGSSGMAAIAAEMPARRFSPSGWPRKKPTPTVKAIRPIATTSRMRTSRSSSRWRGERRRSRDAQPAGDATELGLLPDRRHDALAAPSDDAGPRVGHRAAARPARRRRPPGRRERAPGWTPRSATLRSSSSRSARVSRRSAGTTSPPWSSTTSPVRASRPARRTTRRPAGPAPCGADAARNASSARSPRYSVTTSAPTIGMQADEDQQAVAHLARARSPGCRREAAEARTAR